MFGLPILLTTMLYPMLTSRTSSSSGSSAHYRSHSLLRDPFDTNNLLSPKSREAVQCEKVKDANGAPKDKEFYERTMALAFAEGRRVLSEDGVGSVVFAHKTTEGWEALLSGMIRGWLDDYRLLAGGN